MKRVVIVGAGFGGLVCAQQLDGAAVEVLLVDRQNYHLFTPLLYQVATSLLNPSDIAYPIRKVFRGSPNVRFRQAEVVDVDVAQRALQTAAGDTIQYDFLVLATGSTTHFFGNAAVEKQALGLKTLAEALQLRNHLLECLERASCADEHTQRSLLTFVVVGGGPTGVEFAGALAELLRLVVAKEYPQISVTPSIILLEGQGQLLGFLSPKLAQYTAQRLQQLGVEVRTGTLLADADEHGATLKSGEHIACRTVVWSAGVRAAVVDNGAALELTERSRRIEVDGHMRLAGQRRVFAIGDVAAALHDGEELPMMSPPAMQQGRYVARFIMAHLADQHDAPPTMAPFRYVDKGAMATIGRNAAVCAAGGWALTGFAGWLGWLGVHIYYLIGFRNRLVVLWTWCWNYVWYDRPVRIIARARRSQRLHPPSAAPPDAPEGG